MTAAASPRSVAAMPMVTCPHCGERTFTIAGWAAVDRCPSCGKPLGTEEAPEDRALGKRRAEWVRRFQRPGAGRRFARPGSGRDRPAERRKPRAASRARVSG